MYLPYSIIQNSFTALKFFCSLHELLIWPFLLTHNVINVLDYWAKGAKQGSNSDSALQPKLSILSLACIYEGNTFFHDGKVVLSCPTWMHNFKKSTYNVLYHKKITLYHSTIELSKILYCWIYCKICLQIIAIYLLWDNIWYCLCEQRKNYETCVSYILTQ